MTESLTAKSVNQEEQIIFWRQHPDIAAKDILDVDLDWYQRLVLQQMWFHPQNTNILSRGTGKCISPDSIVITGTGMMTMGEIGDLGEVVERNSDQELRAVSIAVSSPTGTCTATHWYNDGYREGWTVTTDYGFGVSGTPVHRVMCLVDGEYVEKQLEDISPGDLVVISRGQRMFGSQLDIEYSPLPGKATGRPASEHPLPDRMSEDLAYLMGLLSGDGTCGYDGWVMLTSDDQQLLDGFVELCIKLFQHTPTEVSRPDRCRGRKLHSVWIRNYLEHLGLLKHGAREKSIPVSVLRAPESIVRAYLQGLFDTDGGVDKRNLITLGTSSEVMSKQVQVVLANLGIISDRRYKPQVDAWELEIASDEVDVFMDRVGFRLNRKTEDVRRTMPPFRNPNRDVVPGVTGLLRELKQTAIDAGITISKTVPQYQKLYAYIAGRYSPSWKSLRRILDALVGVSESSPYQKLKKLLCDRPFLDPVVSKVAYKGTVCDLVVPEGHLFIANAMVQHNTFLNAIAASLEGILKPSYRIGLIGPSFRQTKFMWGEIEKLWERSPIFQQSTNGHPCTTPDKCYLKFNAAERQVGTVIEALPMGSDGAKIRGARYFSTYVDEGAQVEKEIFDVVVRGFAATRSNPMEAVRMVQEQKRLLEEGLITEDQMLKPPPNRLTFSTTAFYQYNHAWSRVSGLIEAITQDYRNAQRTNKDLSKFTMRGQPLNGGQIPHRIISDGVRSLSCFTCMDPSEGFIDMASIEEAKREMNDYQFKMEYFAFFPPDSVGFFRRSALDKARAHTEFGPILNPRKGCKYAMGVDPARDGDNFSIAVFEIDENGAIRLVRVFSWNKKSFPEAHRNVRWIIRHYGIEYFEMDAGGGGTTIRDLLASKENLPIGEKLILEQEFDEHKPLLGDRILGPLVQFSSGNWVHDANHELLSGLQHGTLRIAAKPPLPGEIWTQEAEDADEEIERAIAEMATIVLSSVGSRMHWDTPTKTMRKDRYSAILIGYWAARKVAGKRNTQRKLCGGFWG